MAGDCSPVEACSQAVRQYGGHSSVVDSSSPQSSSPATFSPHVGPAKLESSEAPAAFKKESSFPGGFPMPYYITKKHGGLPLPLRKTDCSPIEGFVWFKHKCYPVGELTQTSAGPSVDGGGDEQLDWIVGLDGERRLGLALSESENADESSFPIPHYLLADEQFYPMAYDDDGIPLEGTVRHPNNPDILVPVGLQVFQKDSDQDCLTNDEFGAARKDPSSLPRPVAGVIRMIDGKKCFGVPVHELAGWSTHYTQKAEQDIDSLSDSSKCQTPKPNQGCAQPEESQKPFAKSIVHRIASMEGSAQQDADDELCVNFTEGLLRTGPSRKESTGAGESGTHSAGVEGGRGSLLSLTSSFLKNLPHAAPLLDPIRQGLTPCPPEAEPLTHRRALSSYVSSLTRILAASTGSAGNRPSVQTHQETIINPTVRSTHHGSINPMFTGLMAKKSLAENLGAATALEAPDYNSGGDSPSQNFLYQLSKQQQSKPFFTPDNQKGQSTRQVCEEFLNNQFHYGSQAPLATPPPRQITGGGVQRILGPPASQQVRIEANQHRPYQFMPAPPQSHPACSQFTPLPTTPPNCFAFFNRPPEFLGQNFKYSPPPHQHISPPSRTLPPPVPFQVPLSRSPKSFQPSPLTRVFTQPPPAAGRSFTQPPPAAGRSYTQPPPDAGRFFTQAPPPHATRFSIQAPPPDAGRSLTQAPPHAARLCTQPPPHAARFFTQAPPPDAGRSLTQAPPDAARLCTQPPPAAGRSFTQAPVASGGFFFQPPLAARGGYSPPGAALPGSFTPVAAAPDVVTPEWSQVYRSTTHYGPSWTPTPNNPRPFEGVATMPVLRPVQSGVPSPVTHAPLYRSRGYSSPASPCPGPSTFYPSPSQWQSPQTYDIKLLHSSSTAASPKAMTQLGHRAVMGPRGEFVPPSNDLALEDGSDGLLTSNLGREEWVVLDEGNREGRSRSRSANGFGLDGCVKEDRDVGGLCGGGGENSLKSSTSYRRNVHHSASRRFAQNKSSSSLPWYCLCGANTAEKRKSSQKSVR